MSDNATQRHANPLATYTWYDFIVRLRRHWPHDGGQKAFSHYTGYTESQVQHWRRHNCVPLAAVTAISEMPSTPEGFLKKQRGTSDLHSEKFVSRVIELSNATPKPTIPTIASKLSREFKFDVSDSMVKGIRLRNKDRIEGYQVRKKGTDNGG